MADDTSTETWRVETVVGRRPVTYNRRAPMPILDERTLEFHSHSAEQTERLGVRLGELIQPGDLICLAGDLGAGKTVFTRGIARGWGSLDPVTSPTFVLINEYRRGDDSRLSHIDAFRIGGAREALDLGLRELLDDPGPVVVEWPERLTGAMPSERLWIQLAWVEDSRRHLRLEASGPRYERLLRDYRQAAFGG